MRMHLIPMSEKSCCSGLSDEVLSKPITARGETASASLSSSIQGKVTSYHIENMDCPSEAVLIRKALGGLPGVLDLEFNLIARSLKVHHELDDSAFITESLMSIGMRAKQIESGRSIKSRAEPVQPISKNTKLLLAVSGIGATSAEVLAWVTHNDSSLLVVLLAAISIATGGLPTLRKGWVALKTLTLNINFLMSLAVAGAVALGQWPEAAMVVFLFAVAELIETLALNRARDAVGGLLRLTPEVATVLSTDGSVLTVNVELIDVGSTVRVKPGERIPLDGIVTAGESSVNQAPITGESMPVTKQRDDTVFAGSINENGVLDLRVSANSGDTTLAKIIRIIDETQGNQAPTQRFVDGFARYYTPAVVIFAIAVALIPPLLFGGDFSSWVYKALVMLVIACPCALVISTPVTVVSGLTAASRKGILIKGGQFLELGYKLKAIAVDKTGTLTEGVPNVTEVHSFGVMPQERVLLLAASLDANSDHPLARAVVRAGPDSKEHKAVTGFSALPGRGVKGIIDETTYYLGNLRQIEELGIHCPTTQSVLSDSLESVATKVYLATDEEVLGLIEIADAVRATAAEVVARLEGLGVSVVMLTGDNEATAKHVAEEVGIRHVKAEMLPEQKLAAVKALQLQYGVVGMVGDGINDAPSLAQADIGFAMGAAGSDVAIETADVALMADDLLKLPNFIVLSRRTRRVLVQNIVAAIGIKAVFFVLALLGMATLWMAVFADVGASILVVMNGLRLLKNQNREGE